MSFQEYLTRVYFLTHLLLAAAFLVTNLWSWGIHRSKLSTKSSHQLRVSQLLVLAALVSGLLAPSLPNGLFPSVKVWVTSRIQPAALGLQGQDQDQDPSAQ